MVFAGDISHFKAPPLAHRSKASLYPNLSSLPCSFPQKFPFPNPIVVAFPNQKKPPYSKLLPGKCMKSSPNFAFEERDGFTDCSDQEDGCVSDGTDVMESPWEGAILYQRDFSVSHIEYCTTLERLGLGNLSTDVSRSRASLMGMRVTNSVKDFPMGTPVLVSVDVKRKKGKLRLDGIIRTVITLGCNRCGEPAAECLFSNFTVLLSEEPIEEPDTVNLGVIFGQDKFGKPASSEEEEDEDVDFDDRLYFPPEEKVIDISKNIRDTVHIEITLNALCDPACKGMCLECGVNLNTDRCRCSRNEKVKGKYGPLEGLRERMRQW